MSKTKMSSDQNKRTDPGPSHLNKTATTPCKLCNSEQITAKSLFITYMQLFAAFMLALGIMGGSITLIAKLWGELQ